MFLIRANIITVSLIAVSKYSNDAAQQGRTESIYMAPLAAAIQPMHDLGAPLQPAEISCMLVFAEGGKLEYLEKNPRSKVENEYKLGPHDVHSGNQTWVTLVGGECSHH